MGALGRGRMVAIVCVLACTGTAAHAQVCGDANTDTAVNSTDAVEMLREAVHLSSICTAARCDMTGDGAVNSSDAVQALRAAVHLEFSADCAQGEASSLTGAAIDMSGIFKSGFDAGSSSAAAAAPGDTCADGGAIVPGPNGLVYQACRIGTLTCNGTAVQDGSTITFNLQCVDDLFGAVSVAGPLTLSKSTNTLEGTVGATSELLGNFSLAFTRVSNTLSNVGTPLSGQITVNLLGTPGAAATSTFVVQLTFDGSKFVGVTLVIDGDIAGVFQFNVLTGELIEVPF